MYLRQNSNISNNDPYHHVSKQSVGYPVVQGQCHFLSPPTPTSVQDAALASVLNPCCQVVHCACVSVHEAWHHEGSGNCETSVLVSATYISHIAKW